MIQVRGLGFSYGDRPVLSGIDVEVREGEVLGVIGPNGCGKSTLLGLMRGVLRPSAGEVVLAGRPVHRVPRREVARHIAVVPQTVAASFAYPVCEVVVMGRHARSGVLGGLGAADRRAAERAMALTDTLHLAERAVTMLSGGELQRVALARALAQSTPMLFLDEATSHLDLDHTLEVTDLILRLNRETRTTVVQVSHDMDLAADISHRLLLLSREGRPVALGSPEEVLTAENLREVYRVDVRVEENPYTGKPRVLPPPRRVAGAGRPRRAHVVCGGGSASELLRRLHLAGWELSAGPLNRGDSDEVLARALELRSVVEEAFCPISTSSLAAARRMVGESEAVIVAPTAWGPGNVDCLALAEETLASGKAVFLVDPRPERDFTGEQAWRRVQGLAQQGACVVPDVDALLAALEQMGPDLRSSV